MTAATDGSPRAGSVASSQVASATASSLSSATTSPVAWRIPWLAPPANPWLSRFLTTRAPKRRPTSDTSDPAEPLSTTTN